LRGTAAAHAPAGARGRHAWAGARGLVARHAQRRPGRRARVRPVESRVRDHARSRSRAGAAVDPHNRHARARARGSVHRRALGAARRRRDVPSLRDHRGPAGRAALRSRGPRPGGRARRGGGAAAASCSHRRADGGDAMSTLIDGRTAISSAEARDLRDRFVPKGLSVGTPVVVARAAGAEVWDPEGKRYLDFVSGIGALNLGHQHPEVLAAVREQLERYGHVSAQAVTYEPYVRLARELDRIYPRASGAAPGVELALATKSVFANSGA